MSKILLTILLLVGCRGTPFKDPQISLIQNMDDQTSFGPQSQNEFYKNHSAYRNPPVGTVAQGDENVVLGDEKEPRRIKIRAMNEAPYKLTSKFLKDGQKHFNISCAPCHSPSGRGNGLVTQNSGGTIRPPNFHDAKVMNLQLGEIYDSITHGVNNYNMPAFQHALNEEQRWAVACYVRALQLLKEQGGS